MLLLSKCSSRSRDFYLAVALTVLVVVFNAASFGQTSDTTPSDNPSLGDLARKQREKQQAKDKDKDKDAKSKKLVTNEDLPARPEPASAGSDSCANHESSVAASAVPAGAVMENGEQWKAAITQQKNAIADLKSHIDKVRDSIHFVEANAYRNGVEYNKIQAQKQQEVERLQGQLDEQQKNLDKMQETARKAGFGSAVWDP